MLGQMVAFIKDYQADVGIFQRLYGGLCPLIEPGQGTLLLYPFLSHLFAIFLHLLFEMNRVFQS